MTVNFASWAQKSNSTKIYLVELDVLHLASGIVTRLYLSSHTVTLGNICYIGCIEGIPRLTRQINDTMTPSSSPSWGELGVLIEPDFCPDPANSLPWSVLLSDEYTFNSQDLQILLGGEDFAYADFQPIFAGAVGKVSCDDGAATFVIYDKTYFLESVDVPSYYLPSDRAEIPEGNWDAFLPIVYGFVRNYELRLVDSVNYKYALAGHVVNAVVAVRADKTLLTVTTGAPGSGQYRLNQRDVSQAIKDGLGSATVDTSGPYTGSLFKAEWLLEIDSITTPNSQNTYGPEVGLATFRWKLVGDTAWRDEGILTWKLGPDTVTKSPAVGAAAMAVSGDYTGDCKLNYKVKVVREGDIEDAAPPRVIWSDDGGATWQPNDEASWTPVASAPGVMTVTAFNPYDVVQVEITTGGNVGGAVRFKWSNDGSVTWNEDNQIPDTSPIELFSGYSVQFTAPGEAGIDDYDAGDAGGTALAVDVLSVDPPTIPPEAVSIPLNRGLNADLSGDGVSTPTWTWTPAGSAPGVGSVVAGDPQDVSLEITSGGACGVATFNWTVGVDSGSGTTSASPQELVPGYSVQFTAPSEPGVDDYDTGDASVIGSSYTPAFVVNDLWSFTFKEIPVPLADGVSIQFFTQAGQDFYLLDKFNFILYSTITVPGSAELDITAEVEGKISAVTGAFVDKAADIIHDLISSWAGWDETDEFDLVALAAFNAAFPYGMGILIDSPVVVREIIDQLLAGFPALYTTRLDGKFFIAEIAAPSGAPEITFTDIDSWDHSAEKSENTEINHRVFLNYDRNHTQSDEPGGADSAFFEWVKNEWRLAQKRDDTILDTYPLAKPLGPIDTCIVSKEDADLLCTKLLALLSTEHRKQMFTCSIQPFILELWDKITVNRELFGTEGGVLFGIIGLDLDFGASEASLTGWR